MPDLTVKEAQEGEQGELVRFQAYENVENDKKAGEDTSKSARPTLPNQALAPSVFVRLFQDAFTAFQKHRSVMFVCIFASQVSGSLI